MLFSEMKLDGRILSAVDAMGFKEPTPIQRQAIPVAQSGKDLCACAQTGSGKTASFLLPVIEALANDPVNAAPSRSKPRALVLSPTRELATQTYDNARAMAKNIRGFRSVLMVGGAPFFPQKRALRGRVDLAIATPGRLMDHCSEGNVDLSDVGILVLDEADRMLDMGFIDDVRKIASMLRQDRQTLLFSATLKGEIGKVAESFTKDPERIDVEPEEKPNDIEQSLYWCDDRRHKNRILARLLEDPAINQAIVFTATKSMTETLCGDLRELGLDARFLHGDLRQSRRDRVLRQAREGRVKVIVATDVAARGIDVATITHVFNYDIPMQAEDYVHRIGRTGRAGRSGVAATLASCDELDEVRAIERYIQKPIPVATLENLEPTMEPSSKKALKRRGSGKRRSSRSGWRQGGRAGAQGGRSFSRRSEEPRGRAGFESEGYGPRDRFDGRDGRADAQGEGRGEYGAGRGRCRSRSLRDAETGFDGNDRCERTRRRAPRARDEDEGRFRGRARGDAGGFERSGSDRERRCSK